MDISGIQHRRNLLVASGAPALILVIIGGAFGFVNSWTAKLALHPDYYKIALKELARQHYQGTGTTTIVKELDRCREFFEQEYNFRNRRNHIPEEPVKEPEDEVLSFSYLPRSKKLNDITMDDIFIRGARPQIKFPQPAGDPVALWIYSRRENLLVCFFYEVPDEDELKNPGLRIFQTIDRQGVITIQGEFPDSEVTPYEGYLQSLNLLELENLAPWSKLEMNLDKLDLTMPVLFNSAITDKKIRPHFNDPELISRMKREAAFPFLLVQYSARWMALPIGLLWLGLIFWRLRKLLLSYRFHLAMLPAAGEAERIGFVPFLYSDLDSAIREAKAREHQLTIAEREESERRELKELLQGYKNELGLHPNEATQFDEALSGDSLDDLRKLRDTYHNSIQQQRQQFEAEQQQLRERQREIQRLECELEAVPAEKRNDEAREAWTLYQQAKSNDDQKTKLHLLKEARKRLPKEFRPERF